MSGTAIAGGTSVINLAHSSSTSAKSNSSILCFFATFAMPCSIGGSVALRFGEHTGADGSQAATRLPPQQGPPTILLFARQDP
jgi:hypothetical protein